MGTRPDLGGGCPGLKKQYETVSGRINDIKEITDDPFLQAIADEYLLQMSEDYTGNCAGSGTNNTQGNSTGTTIDSSGLVTQSGSGPTKNFILVKIADVPDKAYTLFHFPSPGRAASDLSNCTIVRHFADKTSAEAFVQSWSDGGGNNNVYIDGKKCANLVGRAGADTEFGLP